MAEVAHSDMAVEAILVNVRSELKGLALRRADEHIDRVRLLTAECVAEYFRKGADLSQITRSRARPTTSRPASTDTLAAMLAASASALRCGTWQS